MEMPRALRNLISLANSTGSKSTGVMTKLSAMIITPNNEQIPLIMPSGLARYSMYALNHSDDYRLRAQIQPGVYFNKVLSNKDNLFIEISERSGLSQTMKRFRAIPLGDSDPQMAGNSSQLANLDAKDQLNIIGVTFQLMEIGYGILKNEMVSDRHLMSTLDTVLHYQLTKYGKALNLTGADAWKGVDIEKPIDNAKIFKMVVIPSAIPLRKLGPWLQDHEEFGIYSKGLGMYYHKGMWYIFPLFKIGRYEKAKRVLNIYRLPPDVVPTLHVSYFVEGNVITILSTGEAKHVDGNDIVRQNKGTGKRIVSSDAIMGETGSAYGKGQVGISRQDTLSEYQTSKRTSGEEIAPFNPTPTNNLCKHLTANSFNDGTLETIQWNNSNHDLLFPGMPVRFFYMSGDLLKYKEGSLLGARSEHQKDNESTDIVFRQHSALSLFLVNKEIDAV